MQHQGKYAAGGLVHAAHLSFNQLACWIVSCVQCSLHVERVQAGLLALSKPDGRLHL